MRGIKLIPNIPCACMPCTIINYHAIEDKKTWRFLFKEQIHNPPNFPIYRSDRTKFWWYLTCSEVRADHENVLFDFHSLGNMTIGAWLLHRIRCWTGKRSQGFVMIFCLRYGEWISKGRHLLDTFFALCRCLLSLNDLVRKWETKISKGRHVFCLLSMFVFAQELSAPL